MGDRDARSLYGTHGDVLTAVSEGMVALLKEYYGRGPTQAKTYYMDDLVVCLLRGGFTRVEQTLLDGGRVPRSTGALLAFAHPREAEHRVRQPS
jgi:hypothetical protein